MSGNDGAAVERGMFMKKKGMEESRQRKYDSYEKSGKSELRKKLREKPYALIYTQRIREQIDANK